MRGPTPRGRIVPRGKQLARNNGTQRVAAPDSPGSHDLTLSDLNMIGGRVAEEIAKFDDIFRGANATLNEGGEGRYQGEGVSHPADNADTCAAGELAAMQMGRATWRRNSSLHIARKAIKLATDALEAGEANIYFTGMCVQCGNPIGLPRIMAIPETVVCLHCA